MISVLYKCPMRAGQEQGRGKVQGPGVVLDTAVSTITAPSFKSNISFAFPCHACTRGRYNALRRALNELTGRKEGNGVLDDLCTVQTPFANLAELFRERKSTGSRRRVGRCFRHQHRARPRFESFPPSATLLATHKMSEQHTPSST